jgi:hypothetical protein
MARTFFGSEKASAKGRPKFKNSVLSLAKMQPGLNIKMFPHNRRLALMILYARPDLARTATYQIYDALTTGKTCLFSSSKGYKCFLLNLHWTLLTTLLAGISCSGNPELVKQIVMMALNAK